MEEKRIHPRFEKQYTIKFALKDDPQKICDVPRLLDISIGGLKFFSSKQYFLGTRLIIYIKFPFMAPHETAIDAEVMGIERMEQAKIYKIRVKFIVTDPAIEAVLIRMEEFNKDVSL